MIQRIYDAVSVLVSAAAIVIGIEFLDAFLDFFCGMSGAFLDAAEQLVCFSFGDVQIVIG